MYIILPSAGKALVDFRLGNKGRFQPLFFFQLVFVSFFSFFHIIRVQNNLNDINENRDYFRFLYISTLNFFFLQNCFND